LDGSGPMTSYYIAAEPPKRHLQRIAAAMRQLGNPLPTPHITVTAPSGLAPSLAWLDDVSNLVAHHLQFNIVLGEVDTFKGRVLYLSVQSPGLAQLHEDIGEILAPSQELTTRLPENRPYVPHLTLAIARQTAELPPFHDVVSTLRDLEPFLAVEVTVFRRDGTVAPYRPWLRLPLAIRQDS
jgi:2'-5' RNA ligase